MVKQEYQRFIPQIMKDTGAKNYQKLMDLSDDREARGAVINRSKY